MQRIEQIGVDQHFDLWLSTSMLILEVTHWNWTEYFNKISKITNLRFSSAVSIHCYVGHIER